MSQPIRLIWVDFGSETFTVAPYVVSRLVLSPIVTRPAAQQQHRVSWALVVVGGPSHYVVNPTRVEVELGCDNSP